MKPQTHNSASKVTVGVPVYNGEALLSATLDSILAQTYNDFELVVLDNASTDRTPDIVRDYAARDRRVVYYRNDENIGAAPNHNKLLRMVTSKYFQWCSADNLFGPTLVEKCVALLDSDPTLLIAHSYANVVDDFKGETVPMHVDYSALSSNDAAVRAKGAFLKIVGFNDPIFGMMRREQVAKSRLLGSYIGADDVLMVELAVMGRFGVVPEFLIGLRTHAAAYHAIKGHKQDGREDADEAVWFDTRNPSGGRVYPHWRRMREFARAIQLSDMSAVQKTALYAFLLKVAKWRRGLLASEARTFLGFGSR